MCRCYGNNIAVDKKYKALLKERSEGEKERERPQTA